MTDNTQGTYNAAEAIDRLLEKEDVDLLLAIARYKSSCLELFGRAGLVEVMRSAIDEAKNVEYFSRRSRKEINPLRPEVNVRVDHEAAVAEDSELSSRWKFKLANGLSEKELLSIKSDVLHTQVCRTITEVLNKALQPHWERTKKNAKDRYVDLNDELLRLMLCTIFAVRTENGDNGTAPKDRMVTLLFFV